MASGHSTLTAIKLAILCTLLLYATTVCGYHYNGSCSSSIECIPRETYMRCTRGHCLCAADADYDFRKLHCRLKINVKCHLTGNNIQPCVRNAFCDPPSFADGQKIHAATTGNCVCYQGESIEEVGTCSGAHSFQRSFGHSSIIVSTYLNAVVVIASASVATLGLLLM